MTKSINIDWKSLGAELANLSDGEQGEFFRGFTEELLHWPTHYAREMQCMSIRAKLTEEQRGYIASIGYEDAE